MLLKSIELENFRQYKGKQKIDFSTDPKSNVTVLLGKNTGGKTTLVQAFIWALYGKSKFEKGSSVLNSDVRLSTRTNDESIARVQLTLKHEGIDYIVERIQKARAYSNGTVKDDGDSVATVWYFPNGQMERCPEQTWEVVEKILPETLYPYFFFDGENIEKISNKSNIREAVPNIMGLTPLKNMSRHLLKVRDSFRNDLKAGSDAAALESLRRREQSKEKELESKKEISERTKLELDGHIRDKEGYEDILRDNKDSIDLMAKRDAIQKDINEKQQQIDGCYTRIFKKFGQDLFLIFGQSLFRLSEKRISELDLTDKGIPNMDAKSIDFIIKRGKCICGTDISNRPDLKAHMVEERNYMPPESIGTIVSGYKKDLHHNIQMAEASTDYFNENFTDWSDYMGKFEDKEEEYKSVMKQLKNCSNIDVKEITEKLNRAKDNEKDCRDRMSFAKLDGERVGRELDEIRKEIENHGRMNDANKIPLACISYVEELYRQIESTIKVKEKEILEKLNDKIKDNFSKMYHGNREISIDDSYNIRMNVTEHGSLEASTGLEVVKNFSFVASLLDLAREQMNDTDGTNSEPYPLVMDAPFSNVDEKHISNISKILPETAEQVIMMIMDKDWKYVEPMIKDKVGNKFRLDKKSETFTQITEEF